MPTEKKTPRRATKKATATKYLNLPLTEEMYAAITAAHAAAKTDEPRAAFVRNLLLQAIGRADLTTAIRGPGRPWDDHTKGSP